jgi:hypothetical protein
MSISESIPRTTVTRLVFRRPLRFVATQHLKNVAAQEVFDENGRVIGTRSRERSTCRGFCFAFEVRKAVGAELLEGGNGRRCLR